MHFKILNKALIIVVCSLLFINCSSSPEDSPVIPEEPVNVDIQNFIWKGLNAYYLWQSKKPDLADARFSNQTELNDYLEGFPVPENLFDNLLYTEADRFSWIVDDYIALENSFQGITLNNGMDFGLVRYRTESSKIFGYLRYVIPGSDADSKGVTRGMIFNTIDGTQLTDANYSALLFGENTSYNVEFADYNNGDPIANGNSISLTKTQLQENPVAVAKVITEGTQKIGYLMYNQFASSFDSELNAAFNTFKSEGVNDLIIDLRYNGGGSVRTATYLGGMVTGQYTGQVYSKQIWNEKAMAVFNSESLLNRFTDQINNGITNESINSLNLNRVYFIVSSSSASASELVINSLGAYIDVHLIGNKTVGKQVGSITLYDSDDLTRDGANLNGDHTYAMQPIVLEITNKDGENYIDGITPGVEFPGIEAYESYGNLGVLGERSDPLLNATLNYITTGAKSNILSKIDRSKTVEIFSSKLATPSSNNMYVDLKK